MKFEKMDPNFESRQQGNNEQLNTTQPKRMKVLDDDLMINTEVRVTTATNIRTDRFRRLPPPFSSDKTERHANPLQPVSGVKTEGVIDDLVRLSVEPVDELSSQSSGIDWTELPSPKKEDSVVHWPFVIGAKSSPHESLDSQKQHWSTSFHQAASSTLENSSSESGSSARRPFAIASTPPVDQTLDFPVTPEVYSFPFLTVSDNDQLHELLNQTSRNIHQVIVPRGKQDVEAMQSRTTDPKLGDVDEG